MSPRTPKPTGRRPTELRRRTGTRQENPRYLILGEGPTEVGYFNGLKRRGLQLDVVTPRDDHRSVAREAVNRQADEYDAIWCVLDTELDPVLVRDLLAIVNGTDVKLALSAPCFELWLILHHVDHQRPFQTAREAERELIRIVPGWAKGGSTAFADFKDGLRQAMERAEALDPTGADYDLNPSTNLWQLVGFLTPPR